ncbi:protein TIC 20-II, chloroplastic [Cinnamomum micranthum f. kanehirae]|uniref:Protein TIC 20 n=1 Tax=Cinnamomum micranthum f. kanehirae TaxID=337451 RepID=A0A443Q1A3_9MAGN|nr:protein TIC 20-II, chloroplastic [Cinnamomum micranthum f. kanehirae]
MASLPLLRLSLHPSPKTLKPPTSSLRSPPFLLPLKSTAKISPPPPKPLSSRPRPTISMSYNPTPASDRLISAASYFLPFFNGVQYGRFLFAQYPSLGLLFEPIFPIMSLYRSIPYASFVAFFALYLGVVRNSVFSRYVRFNSMQAVVLDVLLAIPLLLQRILSPSRGLGFRILMLGYNAIFVFVVACFLYSIVFCILGRTPYLPIVASAADRQL